MKIEPLRELFFSELQDLYSAEQQIVRALPRLVKASHNPSLTKALEHHLEESRHHIARIERICGRHKEDACGAVCEAMKVLLREAADDVIEVGDPEISDASLIAAIQRVEHYEIAAYASARTYAEHIGDTDAARFLTQTLEEEKDADAKLSRLSRRVNIETRAA